MDKKIPLIYNYLQEIALHIGNGGLDGGCCDDLSLVEFIALKNALNNQLSIQEIGAVLNFTKSGATRIIDRLENKGYIRRQRSPEDGRVCCVAVTPKGSRTITEMQNKNTEKLEELLQDLEPDAIENISEALEILVKAIKRKEGVK